MADLNPVNWIFGKKKAPTYQAQAYQGSSYSPAYQTTQQRFGVAPPDSYEEDEQAQQTGNTLQDVLVNRMLGNYQQGRPILDEGYRNAVLGRAQTDVDRTARESQNQVTEQMNLNNLAGSTGHGYGLGQVQEQRQRSMQDVTNFLTQQELAQLNNAISGSQQLMAAFAQRGAKNMGAQQFGYNALANENQNLAEDNRYGQNFNAQQSQYGQQFNAGQQQQAYQSQLNRYEDDQRKRGALVGFLGNVGMTAATGGFSGMGRGGMGRAPGGNELAGAMMGRNAILGRPSRLSRQWGTPEYLSRGGG